MDGRTNDFFFSSQSIYRLEPGKCDEYSTPSPITVPAWSTCGDCGESDEGSTPSSEYTAHWSELKEHGEYSTPSPITVPAWSTCGSCGESDEDSTPSSSFKPLAGISGQKERIAVISTRR